MQVTLRPQASTTTPSAPTDGAEAHSTPSSSCEDVATLLASSDVQATQVLYHTHMRGMLLAPQSNEEVSRKIEKPLRSNKMFAPTPETDLPSSMNAMMSAACPSHLQPSARTLNAKERWPQTHETVVNGDGDVVSSSNNLRASRESREYADKLSRALDECAARYRRREASTGPKPGNLKECNTAPMDALTVSRSSHVSDRLGTRSIVTHWVQEHADTHQPNTRPESSRSAYTRPVSASLLRTMQSGLFRPAPTPPPPYFETPLPAPRRQRAAKRPMCAAQRTNIELSSASPSVAVPVCSAAGGSPPPLSPSLLFSNSRRNSSITDKDSGDGSAWLRRVLDEPIRCYRVVRNVSSAPPPLHPRHHVAIHLEDSLRVAEDNLTRCRDSFEHTRYKSHARLEEFLEYRERCRCAVSMSLSEAGEGRARADSGCFAKEGEDVGMQEWMQEVNDVNRTAVAPLLSAMTPMARQRKLDVRCRSASFPNSKVGSEGLQSIWTRKAYLLAMQEEKKKLCARIASFKLEISAAALSVEAMEKLRADVTCMVMNKAVAGHGGASPLFSKEDLAAFLTQRNSLQASLAHVRDVKPSDIVDAMTSSAEASLVKFLFKILPQTSPAS